MTADRKKHDASKRTQTLSLRESIRFSLGFLDRHAMIAAEGNMSKEQEELVQKVKALMQKKFGADDAAALRKLFDAYDANKDGKIDRRELESMLGDAGIGNSFTRGMWVKGVMGELDTNADKLIDWDELSKALG
jgi:hypothetical protein